MVLGKKSEEKSLTAFKNIQQTLGPASNGKAVQPGLSPLNTILPKIFYFAVILE